MMWMLPFFLVTQARTTFCLAFTVVFAAPAVSENVTATSTPMSIRGRKLVFMPLSSSKVARTAAGGKLDPSPFRGSCKRGFRPARYQFEGLPSRYRSGLVKQPGFLERSETGRCLGSEPFSARSDHNACGVTRRFTFRRTGCRRSAAYTRRALFPSPARERGVRACSLSRSTPQATLLTPSGAPLPR